MIEEKLYARLQTVAANVYPLVAPLGYNSPAVVYNRVGTDSVRDLTDDAQTKSFVTFQIDTYSPRYLEAETLARTIRNNLKAWEDPDVELVAYTDKHSSVDNTTQTQLYRVMTFFQVFCAD